MSRPIPSRKWQGGVHLGFISMRYAAPVPSSITKSRPKNPDKFNRRAIFRAATIISALSTNRTTVAGPTRGFRTYGLAAHPS